MHEPDRVSLEEQLVRALSRLAATDSATEKGPAQRAALAALRRGLGQPPGTVPEMYQHVPLLARFSSSTEGDAFLAASLFGLHPREWTDSERLSHPSGKRVAQNFGASLALLAVALNRHQRRRAGSDEGSPDDASGNEEEPAFAGSTAHSGVERRLVALLSADHEDVGEHLRPLMGLLRQHDIPIDWLRLLRDLENWESIDRRVQRNWARSYWGRPQTVSSVPSAPAGD